MKRMRANIRRLIPLMCVLFLLLGGYGGWNLAKSGRRWFSYSSNAYARQEKREVDAGSVLDANGVVLAYTSDGGRSYHGDEDVRRAMVHVLGDAEGNVANGVESFMSWYLYGFDQSFADELAFAARGTRRRGSDVTLTADSALSTEIARWFPTGKKGAVIVMNYRTGAVLALCSFPNFDPNNVTRAVKTDPGHPFFNRAVQGMYAPGSTFKIITMSAMLKTFPDAIDRSYVCDGLLMVGGHLITDAGTDMEGQTVVSHGDIGLERAFRVSCNNTFARAALELGDRRLRAEAENFGYNMNFLFRDLVVENSSYPAENRTDREVAMTGIGQSALLCTPMQVLLTASAVANGGVAMEPRLLRSVTAPGGKETVAFETNVFKRVLTAETAAAVKELMRQTVLSGTGTRAAVSGHRICGKTGSAEIDGQENTNAWFVGFIDEQDTPYAAVVLVEDAGGGGSVAAPIAGRIFAYLTRQ